MNFIKESFNRKSILGLALGFVLSIIVLNVNKKLWLPLELETINGRNTSRWLSNQHSVKSENVVVILFDDKTQFLLRINGLPIKDFEKRGRDLIKTAIQKLEQNDVRAIGLNLNLSNPSVFKSDDELAKTIAKFKNIAIVDSIHSFYSYQSNSILKSSPYIGYGELYADYDRVVHKAKLQEKSVREIPCFSYSLFKASTKSEVDKILKKNNEFYLRYPEKPFEIYSFIDLIQDKINKNQLKNKIVVLGIGLNSKLIRDGLLDPLRRNLFISDSEVQAIALSNLLNNSYLFKCSLIDYPLLFILLSMSLGAVFAAIQTIRRLILGTFLFVCFMAFSQALYAKSQFIVEVVPVLFLLLGNLLIGSLISLQLNLQEQNIELGEALKMLHKRSSELEDSQFELKNKNEQLTSAFDELNERIKELKEVRKQLSTRSEEERKRIARELHDDTLARLTDLKRYIETILTSGALPLSGRSQLGVSVQVLDNVTHDIRRIINALRPSMLDNVLGLIPAIENLLDDLSKRSSYKIRTKLTTSALQLKLDTIEEINLYRIIQEALNNVLKHSSATRVEIFIEAQCGQLLFLIHDNGVGFNPDMDLLQKTSRSSFGLIDMRERAELIGATIQYINKPQGTTLEIVLPYKVVKDEAKESMLLTLSSQVS